MRSFALRLEPAAAPRLAAGVLLYHVLAALVPWLARVPAGLAAALSLAALAGLALTLARLPGRHCRLAGVCHDGRVWRVRLADGQDWLPAELCPASRVFPGLVYLRLRAGGSRPGWLVVPGAVPADEFRRLKARIRLAC
jgi:hypothetical protein